MPTATTTAKDISSKMDQNHPHDFTKRQKYKSTGGWGFQLFEGGDPNKPLVADAAKQCFACHEPKKDHDYVFSTYIP